MKHNNHFLIFYMENLEAKKQKLRRKLRDTVFTEFFSCRENVVKLYGCLHPEIPKEILKEEDFKSCVLKTTLTTGLRNDLSFVYGGKTIVLVEAQTRWDPKIPRRLLEYLILLVDQERKRQLSEKKTVT